eukprot:59188-Pyramimonas_sp.AAC.1
MATDPAALTGATETDGESVAARADEGGDSRSAAPPGNRLRAPFMPGGSLTCRSRRTSTQMPARESQICSCA